MCYSVMIKTSVEGYRTQMKLTTRFENPDELLEIQVYPHGDFPVVTQNEGRHFAMMRYSLIPRWSKVEKPKFATYNARLESLPEKPSWVKPLTENRCLVAFDSFFETCTTGTHQGHVVKFSAANNTLLVAAGIFENWRHPETHQQITSFAIVTTEPSEFIRLTGHDRSPLFLDESHWESWLNPSNHTAKEWQNFLLESHSAPELQVETVRPLKGSPRATKA